jgi:predicted nucleotidyltransferase
MCAEKAEPGAKSMSQTDLLKEKREGILHLAKKYGAYNVRVFGSVARGEADEKEPGRSLLDLIGLLMDLESLLGCKVDVVTVKGLRERMRERVLKEAVVL